MPAYCTANDVKLVAGDVELDDSLIDLLIPMASERVDKFCRRTFATTTASRTYDYTDNTTIRLRDDLVSLTQITTNAGQTFTANQVTLFPKQGPPYRRITLLTALGYYFNYSSSQEDAITVTGVWGYKITIPQPVRVATALYVVSLCNRSDITGLDGVSGGGLSAALAQLTDEMMPMDVQSQLASYRFRRIDGVAA